MRLTFLEKFVPPLRGNHAIGAAGVCESPESHPTKKLWADRHLDASMIFPEIIPFRALPTQTVPSLLREQSIALEPRKGLTVQAHKGFTGFRPTLD